MARLIGYARVSTDDQAESGVSLEDQRRRIALYCGAQGHELVGIEVDAGFSGKSLDRPGAQAVLDAIRVGRADGMIITKLDRWTRNLRDLLDLIDSKGTMVISLGEALDTSSAVGRLVVKVIGSIAEMERELIMERTKAALDHKRTKGEKLGGKAPYGKRVVVNEQGRKALADHVEEQSMISMIRDMHSRRGFSLQMIADAMNCDGWTTRDGGPWKRQYVHRILKSTPKTEGAGA